MKNFPLLFCFVLFLAFAVSAQTNQDLSCPTVNVKGGGVPRLNETSYFTADFDKKEGNLKLSTFELFAAEKLLKDRERKLLRLKY